MNIEHNEAATPVLTPPTEATVLSADEVEQFRTACKESLERLKAMAPGGYHGCATDESIRDEENIQRLFATLDAANARADDAEKKIEAFKPAFNEVFRGSYTPQTEYGKDELQDPEIIRRAVDTSPPLSADVIAVLVWQMQLWDNRMEFMHKTFLGQITRIKELEEAARWRDPAECLPSSSRDVEVKHEGGFVCRGCYEHNMWLIYDAAAAEFEIAAWREIAPPQEPHAE